mmetsp:Transcript_98894/g.262646  ORF Transcript_98894/g.262646 Transcript_98894/m.262646 type:complete len:153 (-) Transcript_98894:177-635(-)
MSNVDIGTLASAICLIGSFCTFVLGVIYLILLMTHLRLHFSECKFMDGDCNRGWRSVFTFNPCVMLDIWTPVILGAIGTCIHLKPSLQFTRITSYAGYAIFMLVTALFGNFGYVSQVGIIIGAFSLLGCLMCIIASLSGQKSLKALALGPST